MSKKRGYDTSLVAILSESDGAKHMVVTMIEQAMTNAEKGDEEERLWLLHDAAGWATFVGIDWDAFQEAIWKKFST